MISKTKIVALSVFMISKTKIVAQKPHGKTAKLKSVWSRFSYSQDYKVNSDSMHQETIYTLHTQSSTIQYCNLMVFTVLDNSGGGRSNCSGSWEKLTNNQH